MMTRERVLALLQGKTTFPAPSGTKEADLPTIAACLKGKQGITLDLSGTGIKAIPDKAFYECTALKAVILPKRLSSIGEGAFSECWCLTSASFGDTGGWYADEGFTQRVPAGQLASHVRRGGSLYKKA